jgi:hypothetical protein
MSKQMDMFLKKIQGLILEAQTWIETGLDKREAYFKQFNASEIASKGEAWLQLYYQAFLFFVEGTTAQVPSFIAKYLIHIEEWVSMPFERGYHHYEALKIYHLLYLINQEIDDCQRLMAKLTRMQAILSLLQKVNVLISQNHLGLDELFVKYQDVLHKSYAIDDLMSHKDELEHMLIDLQVLKEDMMTAYPGIVEEIYEFEQAVNAYLSQINATRSFFQGHVHPQKKQAIHELKQALLGQSMLLTYDIELLKQGSLGKMLMHFPSIMMFIDASQQKRYTSHANINSESLDSSSAEQGSRPFNSSGVFKA